MIRSAKITKYMIMSKEALRYQLQPNEKMKLKYLGIDTMSYGNVVDEVRQPASG